MGIVLRSSDLASREAVDMLEDLEPTARRVFGSAHPDVMWIEFCLRNARSRRAHETPGETPRETTGSFQRASGEKLRARRIVSVADRFRRSAAEAPGGDGSRSTLTVDSQQPPPSEPEVAAPDSAPSLADVVSQFGKAVSDGKFRAAVPDPEPDEGAVNPWLADQISKLAVSREHRA